MMWRNRRDRSYALCLSNDRHSFWGRLQCWLDWLPL